jgi:hypothetical protein
MYNVHLVSQAFIDDTDCHNCDRIPSNYSGDAIRMMHAKMREGTLERLSNADCIRDYAAMIQSTRSNVLLVVDDSDLPPANISKFGTPQIYGLVTEVGLRLM